MENQLNAGTEELLGYIQYLDRIGAAIMRIEDDRSGSGTWIIYYTKD